MSFCSSGSCFLFGASLSAEETAAWEKEHMKMLSKTPSDELEILHHAAMAILRKK